MAVFIIPIKAGHTDYLLGGSLIVKEDKTDRLLFDGGYAKAERIGDTTYGYTLFYYNKDHLGNIREVVNAGGNLQQRTNYYPFGAPYADPNMVINASLQPFKYNGKELDLMHGLNTYDYGARQYDPIAGRWDRVDPLCEKYYSVSPYTYCKNSPVKNIDPDGRAVETAWDFFNVGLDVTSFIGNVKSGNYTSAAVDAGAAVVDLAAAITPFVPGGVGTGLKAYRAGKAAQAVETTMKATKNNYRRVLQKATGKTGKGYEAHHTLPQKWRKQFEELGINIDEPGNVVWRETKGHRKNSSSLSKDWKSFMETKHTKKQVMKKRDELEKKYFGNKEDKPNN